MTCIPPKIRPSSSGSEPYGTEAIPSELDGVWAREADHRIKNHLQLLASYVRLTARKRATAAELAEDIGRKIEVIAGVHAALQPGAPAPETLLAFLKTVCAPFAFTPHILRIEVTPDLTLSAAQLAPVGMIVSEAVTNAVKHAFPVGEVGEIHVRLLQVGAEIRLTIADNGVGHSAFNPLGHAGQSLVVQLARQLRGGFRVHAAPGSFSVHVEFPAATSAPSDRR